MSERDCTLNLGGGYDGSRNFCIRKRRMGWGGARIRRQDGSEFALRPVTTARSPFDIPGVDLKMSAEEIVAFVREGRERS